jgi:hypothetical protein
LGALIAFRLDANREKGGICGGLIASRLLALHGLVPHVLDLQFLVERLDLNSMIHHKFVSSHACLTNLTFEITFFKKSTWKVSKRLIDQSICLHPFCLTLIAGMDGHLQRVSSTRIWRSTRSPCTMKRQPRSRSSLLTLRSSHTSSLIMIIHCLLHLHRGQAITLPMMTHLHGACF